jgi:DNA-binding SARP family transcriptional activator
MSRLELSFLGSFHVTRDQEPIRHFRSANNQGLLAYLALHITQPVPREVLAALFWPDESGENARNNLRQAIYQLRQTLGDGDEGDRAYLLVTRRDVQFNPRSDHTLDVQRFLSAIDRRDLDAAIAIYNGDLLPGFTCESLEFEDWLRLEREKLHELALEAMFEAGQDYLAAGRLDKAQAVARRQLALEPWREPAHRQLMQAYALAGDRAKSLAQYESLREALRAELGLEPAAETVSLVEEIKAGRYGRIATGESIRPPRRVNHNLPADTTPFLGRERELSRIVRLFADDQQRLVTIVGPGGIGKTRLGLAVGANMLDGYEDGVYFVDLAPVEQVADVPQAIAVAIGYQAPDKTSDLKPQLLEFMSRRRLFLILDNFEQLIDGVGLVNEILQACPEVVVLVTSRRSLHLAGENRYELAGLEYPDSMRTDEAMGYPAVRLFVESGRRVQSGFTITEDYVGDVIRICRQVQGMPLALVLAASWLELLSPAEIAGEIEAGLDFLAADLGDLPARQRSMQAVFDRSWQMLTPEEQAVMARLSVFRDGFTREAAEAVVGANLRILLSLTNKSLLQRRPESGRFTIHELLRQYAAARRRAGDLVGETELAHCRYFARLVRVEVRATRMIYQEYVPDRLVHESDNIDRAWFHAVEHGLVDELDDLVLGIFASSHNRGLIPTARIEVAQQALGEQGLAGAHPLMIRLQMTKLRASIGYEEIATLRAAYLEFIPIVEHYGDPLTRVLFYVQLMRIYLWMGDAEALTLAEAVLRIARQIGDDYVLHAAEVHHLTYQMWLGIIDEDKLARLEDLLDLFDLHYPTNGVVLLMLNTLEFAYRKFHEYEKVIQVSTRHLNIAKGWRNLYEIGQASISLAEIHLQMGLPAAAKGHLLDFLDWHLAIGQVWQTLGALWAIVTHFPALLGGKDKIVPILSMIYHHPESVPFHRELILAAEPGYMAEIGESTYRTAWESGKTLDFDTAVKRVRSALASGESI